MKVFIIYSSLDAPCAKRIACALERRGVGTFLDVKDIGTGKKIEDAIRRNLRSCDQVLVLLTCRSVRSPWVLNEVGAAWVLSKRIVPIRVDVSIAKIPAILRGLRVRSIDEIESYYEELVPGDDLPFRVGDTVWVPDSPRRSVPRDGNIEQIVWVRRMDRFCGRRARVTRVEGDGKDAFEIDLDGGQHLWAFEWFSGQGQGGGNHRRNPP